MPRIEAYKELKKDLLQVTKPARYVGGELGSILKDEPLKMGISFPDLYEIGMSNQAVRILYNCYNAIPGIQCERVFAPLMDFEEVLRNKNLPLFTLETGIPLGELDILAFSIGYELTLTNMLAMMELGQIPIRRVDRGPGDPIIVAGGPAATNPAAFADFVDAVYIGEGEPFAEVYGPELAAAKKGGASREDLLQILKKDPAYWYPGKTERTLRSIYSPFGTVFDPRSNLPLASLTTVQEHGVVEIMRGCPNGCRFCHAGYFYRPFRQKDVPLILEEAEHLVSRCGFRNITLSSLSSGDYQGLLPLVEELNRRYKHRHISFQLPSLRVNSLNLDLLGQISAVRRSGLTFAVETPDAAGQAGINKDVSREKIISLLKEAKSKGWKLAKFYFMVGLPVSSEERSEGEAIVDFLQEIQKETAVKMNVNVGVFIPKPHTPYDREKQFTDAEGMREIGIIREGLRGKNFKVGFHSPYSSFVEGILSRGDERVGDILEKAFRAGARFDAWDEYHDRSIWKRVIEEASWDVEKETCRARDKDEPLPWDSISLRVSPSYLARENERSGESQRTVACEEECTNPCGVCGTRETVRYPETFSYEGNSLPEEAESAEAAAEEPLKAIFSFKKEGRAIYLGHLDTIHIFERAFQCAALPLKFTEGFNPKPKMEFAHPLSLGITGEQEILGVELTGRPDLRDEEVLERMNAFLPEGFALTQLKLLPLQQDKSKKKKTLMGLYAGSEYRLTWEKGGEGILSSAASLLDAMEETARRLEVREDYEFQEEQGGIAVRARFQNKKMNNVVKFLGEVLGEDPFLHIEFTRTTLLAQNRNARKISSYLDLDSSQS